MRVILVSKSAGAKAFGEYNPDTGSLTVLKGSVLSITISTSPTFRGRNSIIKARTGRVKDDILIEDVVFKSPSTAANFVTGNSTNGKRAWRNEDGVAIGDL